jgi:iron complex outermembrane receptor protein
MKLGASIWAVLLATVAGMPISEASMIRGKLTDSQSGEAVPGAYIKISNSDKSTISDPNGEFVVGDIELTEARLVINVIGYEVAVRKIKSHDFEKVNIALDPAIVRGQDVVVTATRAKAGETPAAFSNLPNEELDKRYWSQDMPVLLSALPNAYAYSDAGNGIGYSYLKIRGFDQKRIAVMLNGIPLNDAESHEVFWVDLPDLVASARDIQVQRGVGSSLYGASALGGSVNLVTGVSSYLPNISIESGMGSYDTRKFSVEGSSGLINDTYSFSGRYSRIETDGYRDKSWTKAYSYFMGLTRFDESMTWRFNTYGGPEESHLAYKGITNELLLRDRRYNELQFDGEIDHFSQPHYELFNDWEISNNSILSNTLYYFSGDGYYNQMRSARDVEEYFPGYFGFSVADSMLFPRDYYDLQDDGSFARNADSLFTLRKIDLIRRPTVVETDWGWIPRVTFKHNKGEFTAGGEIRIHEGHHFGEVIWAGLYPSELPANIHYYDYKTQSRDFSAFLLETFRPSGRLSLLANLQYQRHFYRLQNDRRFEVEFKRHFDSISPRLGVNFIATQDLRLFSSVSTASRHPAFKDIYDPTDYWSNPQYKPDNFRTRDDGWAFAGKELKPERLLDFEFGFDFIPGENSLPFECAFNLYRMEITNEILPYSGQIDDMGYPISGNAEKAIHQGAELSLLSRFPLDFRVTGNLSVNDDHFDKYKEYGFDYVNWVALEFDRSGKRIGGFPNYLSNLRIDWSSRGIACGLGARLVGSQFIDNGEANRIASYRLFDFDISYKLEHPVGLNSLLFSMRFNNLTNEKYVAAGYMEPDDNLPRYMVGAERNFYVSLRASL